MSTSTYAFSIPSDLADRVATNAKRLKEDTDDFKELYRDLCVHWGGPTWHKSQFEKIFRHIRSEITPIMEAAGHQRQYIRSFCCGAENCLITDAPFKFYKRSPETLFAAKKIVDQDNSDRKTEDKWRHAFVQIEKQKRELEQGRRSGVKTSLMDFPLRDDGEDTVTYRCRVLQRIKSFMESGEARQDLDGDDHTAAALESIYSIACKALDRQEKMSQQTQKSAARSSPEGFRWLV